VRLQSNIKLYQEGRLYSTQSVAHCLWASHRICCLSTLAYYSFTTLPTLPAWSIPTNAPTKLSVLNSDSLTVVVGYGQIVLLWQCEWKFYPIIKRDAWASGQGFLGHRDVSFKKRTAPGKTGHIRTIVYLHIPPNLCTLLILWCISKSLSRPILGVKVTPVVLYLWRGAVFVFYHWLIDRKIDTMVTDCSSRKIKFYNIYNSQMFAL
jgi:hypothetical protein